MKRIALLLLVVAAVIGAKAQTTLLATLSHEGNVTTYYGTNALVEAHNAAADGDLITLSSGQFNAVNITKAVTIRGAGFDSDATTGRQPTFLSGDFSISAPEGETTANLTIEGIYHNFTITYNSNIKNAQFIKCRLKRLTYNSNGSENCSFTLINCRVTEAFMLGNNGEATCINSVIRAPYSWGVKTSNFEFINCVVIGNGDFYLIYSSSFTNCYVYDTSSSSSGELPSSSIANYCIGIKGNGGNPFRNIPTQTNKVAGTEIFESFSADCADDATYKLTEEAAATYLGNDGTQIGIYGGLLPFSSTPGNPQITKFKVAERSTADGKLSIDITVGVPE